MQDKDLEVLTMRSIEEVVERLAEKAGAWGTPPDVIYHHKTQIGKVLKALK